MAKNIVIAEGGTAKSFTAKKIKTKAQGSGTVNWVPEDEVLDYVDLKDKTFTAKGTYKPSDFNCDGFNEVTVDIPADVKEKTITRNGTFYAADDDCLGYSKVTVNVPTGGGGGPFTVVFFDDDRQTVLKTDANVPYDGSTSCTLLDGTVVGGQYFKGWNPSPTKVRSNMNCYPIRGDYIIDPTEIQDDWETICANKGANYPLGAYKSLVLTNNFSFVHRYYNLDKSAYQDVTHSGNYAITMHMVKVAEGEDGSTSSWLSTGAISLGSFTDSWDESRTRWTPTTDAINKRTDWSDCAPNYVLNEGLMGNLPQCLQENIVEVNKSYVSVNPMDKTMNVSKVIKTSKSKIWIPSIPELKTFFCTRIAAGYTDGMFFKGLTNRYTEYRATTDAQATQYYEQLFGDLQGIDYSAIYNPTYNTGAYSYACLRDTVVVSDVRQPMMMQFQSAYRGYLISSGDRISFTAPIGFCL